MLDVLHAARRPAADWDVRFKTQYSVAGFWAGTDVRGDPEAIESLQRTSGHYYQRPDAASFHLDPARDALTGSSGRIGFAKIAGEHLRFNFHTGYKSPGFEVNDIGFLRRADERWTSNWVQVPG